METKKRYKVQQNKTDTRKENITTTKKVCVLVEQGYLCNKKGRVFWYGTNILWTVGGNNFCVGVAGFGKKRLDVCPIDMTGVRKQFLLFTVFTIQGGW